MRSLTRKREARQTQSGYALLLIMFFLALLVLSMAAAAPTVLSSIQREREAEMVWRGHQYIRAVRMYYRRLHRFPTALDDLTQPKNGIRFMRQAYKDPMNQVDGSWRLIYVGPNGQLLGSLMNRSIGLGAQFGQPGALPGANTSLSSAMGSSSIGASSFGNSMQGSLSSSSTNQNAGNPQSNATGSATQSSATSADSGTQNAAESDDPNQPHALGGDMDASNTIGGNIIGVGSKVNRKSFMWYEKAKNYRQFEFIWDPTKDMIVGRAPRGIGTPVQGGPGVPAPLTPGTVAPPPSSTGDNPSPNPVTPDPTQNPPLQAPPNQ
jgi:type II secretory pathway pseudopilin PulG